jgi:Uma2 family endonuclease
MQTLTELDNSLKWYFELHPEEMDMAETYDHMDLGDYLRQVLLWYYRFKNYLILKNQLVFIDKSIHISPDIAVVKDVNLNQAQLKKLKSWRVDPPTRLAPVVVIEISSKSNYPKDIDADKVRQDYTDLGVNEYFAYDPDGFWGEDVRLKGWRRANGQLQAIPLIDNRKIWSEELDCFVVASNEWMWFETIDRKVLLTEAMAQSQRAAEQEQARLVEFDRAEAEKERAEQERLAKEAAQTQAEQERQRAEQERLRAEEERLAKEAAQIQAEQERLAKEAEMLKAEQAKHRAEQERLAKEAEMLKAEQERLAKEAAQTQAEQERLAKEAAQTQAEQERERAEQERKRAERLAAKLRDLEIDPDTL